MKAILIQNRVTATHDWIGTKRAINVIHGQSEISDLVPLSQHVVQTVLVSDEEDDDDDDGAIVDDEDDGAIIQEWGLMMMTMMTQSWVVMRMMMMTQSFKSEEECWRWWG
jgi:hypothetical protein